MQDQGTARFGGPAQPTVALPAHISARKHSHAPCKEPVSPIVIAACHESSSCARICSDSGTHRAYFRACTDAMHGVQARTRAPLMNSTYCRGNTYEAFPDAFIRTFGWTRNLSASLGGTVVAGAAAAPAAGAAARLAVPPFPVLDRFAGRSTILPHVPPVSSRNLLGREALRRRTALRAL